MTNTYTDQQQAFVAAFLEEARVSGDYRSAFIKARDAAGYPETVRKAQIFKEVKELLLEGVGVELAQMIPKMLNQLENVVDNPSLPGAKNIIAAASTLLDRGGVVKQEQIQLKVDVPNGVLILPSKSKIDE